MKISWILLFVYCQLPVSHSLMSYQSLNPPINDTTWDSGIKFLQKSAVENSNFTKGITICISFYFKMIDDYESWILSIDGLTIALR